MSTSDPTKLARRLSKVKHILLVLSGKGGVGKSSISVQLALSLLNQGQNGGETRSAEEAGSERKPVRIGLLDIDLTGPSVPRMLGLDGASIHQSNDGWVPVYLPIQHLQASTSPASSEHLSNQQQDEEDDRLPVASTSAAAPSSTTQSITSPVSNGSFNKTQDEMKVMSIGFLLKDSRQAVVWRGPKKSAMIRQFLADVRWGDLDWLIIDTPPGTSDEHISLLENLLPALQSNPNTTLHSILVTTPQAVSLSDVSKELSFTRRVGLPVLGLVENMSGYVCPHCGDITNIFGRGGGEEFCRLETEKAEKAEEEEKRKQQLEQEQSVSESNGQERNGHLSNSGEMTSSRLTFLGRVPVDPDFVKVVDGPESGKGLLERYNKTKSSAILGEICKKLVEAVEGEIQSSVTKTSEIAQGTEAIVFA